MTSPFAPIEMITYFADRLGDLREQMTFLGGAVTYLLITEFETFAPRATKDVDVAVKLASRMDFYQLEKKLRERGFQNAMEGPICRFYHGSMMLDVMPTLSEILGFSNSWYDTAIRTALKKELPNGKTINLISPACFLATKFEAFDAPNREHQGNLFLSRDFEDIVMLINGRSDIENCVAQSEPDLRSYLKSRFKLLQEHFDYELGVEAHINPRRTELVLGRISAIANQS